MKKYYYIDDEDEKTIQAVADGINVSKKVEVEALKLKGFRVFDVLTEKLKADWDKIDGYLLDLKLNGTGPNSTKFSATSLAQWLRSYAVEEEKPHKPIVLLSNDLQCAHYAADITSHDLFDMVLERNGEIPWESFAEQLEILAEEYARLTEDKDKNLQNILQNERIDGNTSFLAPFVKPESFNVSRFAALVLHDLFEHPGQLIDEPMLAARMGVDIVKSGKEWETFINARFEKAQYKGVFAGLKKLYWSREVINIFKELTKGKSPMSMTAMQRVATLQENDEAARGLVAYHPQGHCKSTYFWTIDAVTKKPLDANEGYVLQEEAGIKAWQEQRYVSFDTIDNGLPEGFELMPSESERYEADLEAID
ncbi:hypothetical protein SAMN04487850_2198 [Prevotella aff. ruminicola Tc2-24]|uniref:Uncharacterized protein n=1 Tax=Prevotella aff. ruminicola Tc2-24 TaxID=81582 RepID=A0A1I0Q3Q5_9BACT|nr:hypothetical protein [Prevotella aff. ruminicola Tc2-24]SEW21424.1 hypothetical protein SAMN04487850_2198 [Prevotella aff. ruminicola Tc2-24]